MRRAWLLLLLVSAGCASAPIKKNDVAALVEADARVLSGCYDCLIDARDTYQRVAVGKARPLVIARLFEVQWLLAMRERELSLDWTSSLEKARTLAKELPPTYDGARVLALVDVELPDDYGWPAVQFGVFRREHQPYMAKVDAELEWLAASPVSTTPRQYLAMAIDCDYRSRGGPGQVRRPPGYKPELPPDPAPLLMFRHAICSGFDLIGAREGPRERAALRRDVVLRRPRLARADPADRRHRQAARGHRRVLPALSAVVVSDLSPRSLQPADRRLPGGAEVLRRDRSRCRRSIRTRCSAAPSA